MNLATHDEMEQLPLHIAFQTNVRLGSIKLLLNGNPPTVQFPHNCGALTLHVACEHITNLLVLFNTWLDLVQQLEAVDRKGNTVLHLA